MSFHYQPATPVHPFNPDRYLLQILHREAVPTGPTSAAMKALIGLYPLIRQWANIHLASMFPSGSYAKGTAVRSGTDIDLFISLKHTTLVTLEDIYWSLFDFLKNRGFNPKAQNVSINIRVDGVDIDLVPGRLQNALGGYHSLYKRKVRSWQQTHVQRHVAHVRSFNRLPETRLMKVWRNQWNLDFPSFYLEMVVIEAMKDAPAMNPAKRVVRVLEYLRDKFPTSRFVDPANTNNVISDDLTATERMTIRAAADRALRGSWAEFIR
ncbi:MAG: nucleotidyltransferase domain-containing protein [Bradyrhizobium sp.]|nr:nucleotidyltransferase domain-containing protein [Bradyrhizobium sp.]